MAAPPAVPAIQRQVAKPAGMPASRVPPVPTPAFAARRPACPAPPPVGIAGGNRVAVQPRLAVLPPPPQPRAAGLVPAPPTAKGIKPKLLPGTVQLRVAKPHGSSIPPPPVPKAPTRGRAIQLHPAAQGRRAAVAPPPVHGRAIQRMEWDDGISTPDRAIIPTAGYNFAASRSVEMGYFPGSQVSRPGPSDLAATHVAPDAGIKHTLTNACRKLLNEHSDPDLIQEGIATINRLVENTKIRNAIILARDNFPVVSKGIGKPRKGKTAHSHAEESNEDIDRAYSALESALNTGEDLDQALQNLHDAISVAPGNLPDYGLHRMFNQPVSDRYHLNVDGSGRLTPISDTAADMGLDDTGVAVSAHGNNLIVRQGGFFPIVNLDQATALKLAAVGYSRTGIASPPAID
jgi:hypothetical protein